MKRFGVMAAAVLFTAAGTAFVANTAGGGNRQRNEKPAAAVRQNGSYVCPMHTEVTSDKPGNCPECGMTLEKREAGRDGATKASEASSCCPGH